eukprot:5322501-Amphidinium_carterae.1
MLLNRFIALSLGHHNASVTSLGKYARKSSSFCLGQETNHVTEVWLPPRNAQRFVYKRIRNDRIDNWLASVE